MKISIEPASMTMGVARRFEGMILKDRFFEVPLDYAHPSGSRIQVFGRVFDRERVRDRVE